VADRDARVPVDLDALGAIRRDERASRLHHRLNLDDVAVAALFVAAAVDAPAAHDGTVQVDPVDPKCAGARRPREWFEQVAELASAAGRR
jgi:hypothetical protein